ncbi:MAG: hypothetical protein E6J34_16590 [Chloroflexi bacterium]|nr:MAG: hypothetical protein E6J34_16590 [Chloroflexota bacterium]
MQILAPDELEPDIHGELRLLDSEGHGQVEVSISASVLQAYRERLADLTQNLAALAHTYMGTYTLIASDTAIIDVVQRLLRQIALVR